MKHSNLLVGYLINQQIQTQHPLYLGYTYIGRATDNHIIISDPSVSRYHVIIHAQRGLLRLLLTQARTPTWLNNQPIYLPSQLEHGDELRFGLSQLRFIVVLSTSHHSS